MLVQLRSQPRAPPSSSSPNANTFSVVSKRESHCKLCGDQRERERERERRGGKLPPPPRALLESHAAVRQSKVHCSCGKKLCTTTCVCLTTHIVHNLQQQPLPSGRKLEAAAAAFAVFKERERRIRWCWEVAETTDIS